MVGIVHGFHVGHNLIRDSVGLLDESQVGLRPEYQLPGIGNGFQIGHLSIALLCPFLSRMYCDLSGTNPSYWSYASRRPKGTVQLHSSDLPPHSLMFLGYCVDSVQVIDRAAYLELPDVKAHGQFRTR